MKYNSVTTKIVGVSIAMSLASAASASFTTEYDASLGFVSDNFASLIGGGLTNENLVRSYNASEGLEIGLKAISDSGADVDNTNDRYFVDAGQGGSSALAQWDFIMAFDLGGRIVNDFDVALTVDFDPAVGVSNIFVLDFNAVGLGGMSQLALRLNLGGSIWGGLGAPSFDPDAIGEYELTLSIRSLSGTLLAESVNTVDNNVQVVPVPTAALAGLGLLGSMGAYRRIRK